MSEKIMLDRKIGFQNTFCTKCINIIIDSIGPSIILRSIFKSGVDFAVRWIFRFLGPIFFFQMTHQKFKLPIKIMFFA